MYSSKVRNHIAHIRNVGQPHGATHRGTAGIPGEGPFITIYLCIQAGALRGAGYHSYACPAAIACASELVETLIGLTVAEALEIQPNQLLERLGGLPEGKHDRLDLALTALESAVSSPIDET